MSVAETHHKFSPSKLKHFELCPGSYRLEAGLPDEESVFAQEGTAMHLAVEHEKILNDFNEEQKDCIQRCIDYLGMIASAGAKWQKETKVSVLDGFDEITCGTMDAICELDDLIVAVDWKFGRSPVMIDDNLQIMAYSCGLMQRFNKPVEFHIAQPRLNYFKSVRFEVEQVVEITDRIKQIIANCTGKQMILNPSETACKWCKAKETCPAVNDMMHNGALSKVEHCSELSTDVIGQYLDEWKVLKKIGASLENQARERLLAGEEIPGWSIRTFQGKRTIKNPQGVYNAIENVVDFEKFMDCVEVKLTPLLDLYARSRREKEMLAGVKISLKQAKAELEEAISPYVEQSSDSNKLMQVGG